PTTVAELLGKLPVDPQWLLSGVAGDCTSVTNALVSGLGVANAAALPGNVSSALLQLCSNLNGAAATISNLPVSGTISTVLSTITELINMPVTLQGGGGGAFTNADGANGTIGQGRGSASPTVRPVL